jgi:hypothetical protein
MCRDTASTLILVFLGILAESFTFEHGVLFNGIVKAEKKIVTFLWNFGQTKI